MMNPLTRSSTVALCLWLLPGCAWMPWVGETEPVRFGVISVCLNTSPPKGERATYAMASVHKGRMLKDAGFKRLSNEGTAAFVLPMGSLCDIRIFYDLNRNQSFDPNEPSGLVQNVTPAADPSPVTLAFGVVGPVASRAIKPSANTAPPARTKEVPPEAEPYLKHVPPWMQEKLLR